ncbi:helix-turn-helix domain-containing protein [Paracoccus beibuensis]|uniref:helix-turn-helix domain-containing protein n=1 Tax=Paracoccus beibuensis TaxID=547602 RepID=UPI002240B273|nr:helix-turn-helix domain-containing protein [Paracoccus beibuensis]
MDRLRAALQHHLDTHATETMRSLSLRAGLNANFVQHVMNKRVENPRIDSIRALARVMRVRPGKLIDD